ncbi:VOC family protein [Ramlibacter alkalitolerans]|uniref:VOC family protein n=1 Tax=Ramlibacter alkalitolerans TaxID=2039631 RepID=A0ABS1JJ96_9BURK|nr:VOC family protein [Ramlibacter alkalitolerans]MBL0424302.1 VOC family protein [Ramlibacter alkalitolerans]
MPVLDSYLFFSGNCAPAMRFYERTLGGTLQTMMTYGQSPDPDHCPAGSADLVMHASLKLGDRTLMASDVPPSMGPKPMAGFSLSLAYGTPEEARRIFDALAQGGSVTMPMTKTFWAETFGMLVDPFGTPWMVSGGMPAA